MIRTVLLAAVLALPGCALVRMPVTLAAGAVTGTVKLVTPDMGDLD
ncbi:hypothetical protein [Palleronia rufa]|nr:hypothetical protein [Palleronia rufa]